MLSTLSSFLPTSLQLTGERTPQPPSPAASSVEPTRTEQETSPSRDTDNENIAAAKKKAIKKEKLANETFIFVRPPPAKSNHPLNLQVQLVPPSTKGDRNANRQSVDMSSAPPVVTEDQPLPPQDPSGATDLSRTTSTRSTEGSMYSGYTSSTSISSYASSSNAGRRMIIPLYNLQAHNVMTNTVVDAGTDAKVAQFKKRGLEIMGLAMLEPVEVWGESNVVVPTASARTSIDGNGSFLSHREVDIMPPPLESPSYLSGRPGTSSSVLSSGASTPQPDISITAPVDSSTGAKKMFGKIFKKSARPPSMNLSPELSSTPRSSFSLSPAARHSRNLSSSLMPPPSVLPTPVSANSVVETPTTANAARPPVLGVQPSMSSPINPPQGRPNKYVWVVRRWLKGADNGLLGGMMGKLNNGKEALGLGSGIAMMSGMGQIQVQFEWSRGKTGSGRKRDKERKDSKRGRRPSATTGQGSSSGSGSRRASDVLSTDPLKEHLRPQTLVAEKRLSGLSQHSVSTTTDTNDDHEMGAGYQEDDGDESDPEDTETPWTCFVSIQRLPPPPSARAMTGGAISPMLQQQYDQPIQLKVATLSPTPHHPKVVSMLKVPFPLPDIEIERMVVRKRALTPQGLARPTTSGNDGLTLTAEEIKDIISCTGLWLVVREGFGGVGKVSRKGDGWRIRG